MAVKEYIYPASDFLHLTSGLFNSCDFFQFNITRK